MVLPFFALALGLIVFGILGAVVLRFSALAPVRPLTLAGVRRCRVRSYAGLCRDLRQVIRQRRRAKISRRRDFLFGRKSRRCNDRRRNHGQVDLAWRETVRLRRLSVSRQHAT